MTVEQFKQVFPKAKNPDLIVQHLNRYFYVYNLNTLNQISGFLAQCGHESGGFTIFKENLNYSVEGLLRTFRKYFTTATALLYAKNPEKIANRVYANRMGNSDEVSGDGWRYAGKGIIQITGKDNYSAFAKDKGISNQEVSEYMMTLEGAIESGFWYWSKNNLNIYCDRDDIEGLTKKINGGLNGLEDRIRLYKLCKEVLKDFSPSIPMV